MKIPKVLLQRLLPPICAVLLIVAAFTPYEEDQPRLRIAPGMWPAAEPLLLAGDMQMLPPDRFQVMEIPWSSAVMRAFGSGAADVVVVTLEGLMRMRDAGQKLKVLMVLNQSAGADAILTREPMQQLGDLKGKRVGIERSSGIYLLISALENAGLTMKDIETVPMLQSEMELALQSGQVDAAVAAEPWLTRLKRSDLHCLYDSTKLKVPIVHLLVASDRACTKSREDLVSLLKIQSEMAAQIWSQTPFPGMDVVQRRERLEPDELRSCLDKLRNLTKTESMEMLKRLPQMAQQMQESLLRDGVILTKPAGGAWINTSVSEEAFR